MKRKSHILNHWDNQAEKHGKSSNASWGDENAIKLEIALISSQITDGDSVLDIGCANGFSIAMQKKLKPKITVSGIDFSKKMIDQALNSGCDGCFDVGDAREIYYCDNTFDVVYTTRVLINLPTWEEQKQGINECIRVCKPGGKIILLEAFWEPLMRLNAIRSVAGLKPLVEHDFNRYIKKEKLGNFLSEKDGIASCTCYDHSSTYYLGTRFIRDLVNRSEKYSGYSDPINDEFYGLQQKYPTDGFGVQQAYIIRKDA